MRAGALRVPQDTKYMVFTNNDVFFPPWTVSGLVGFLESNREVGVASCIEVVPRRDFNPGGTYLDMRLTHNSPRDLSKPYFVTAVENFLVIRREVYDLVGGFDQNFFQVYDDQDLCLRVWMAGYKVACDPAYQVTHMHRFPNKKTPARWYRHIRNRYLVMLKLFDASTLFLYFPLRVATDIYWSIFDGKWRKRRSIILVFRALAELVVHPELYVRSRTRFFKVKRVSEKTLLRLGIIRP
jgi:GT2 family glycosyltransferase